MKYGSATPCNSSSFRSSPVNPATVLYANGFPPASKAAHWSERRAWI